MIITRTIDLPDGYKLPDIHVSRDEDGSLSLEMIFPNSRLVMIIDKGGKVSFCVVSGDYSASGELS